MPFSHPYEANPLHVLPSWLHTVAYELKLVPVRKPRSPDSESYPSYTWYLHVAVVMDVMEL